MMPKGFAFVLKMDQNRWFKKGPMAGPDDSVISLEGLGLGEHAPSRTASFSSLSSALTLSSSFVVDGNQCFLPTAAFLNADRSGLTLVSELREGSEVRSVDDEVVTVTSILEHPEARREIVVLVTRHGQLRVTKDHLIPVRVAGSTEIVRKPAGRIQLDDLVLINNAPSPVKKFREDSLKTRLFAVCFDNPNTRVAVYDVSTSPIQAYGNPNIEDPARRTAFEHSLDLFSEAQLRQAEPGSYHD